MYANTVRASKTKGMKKKGIAVEKPTRGGVRDLLKRETRRRTSRDPNWMRRGIFITREAYTGYIK